MSRDLLRGSQWLIHKDYVSAAVKALATAHRIVGKLAENLDKIDLDVCFGLENNAGPAMVQDFEDGTRMIRIVGVLVADDSISDGMAAFFGLVKTNMVREHVEAAAADEKVKRIVLRIDSPGGQADGISELANAVERADKPVVSHVDGMCCSGAYWVACASDKIYAVSTAMIGSVGAVVTIRNTRRGRDSQVQFVSTQTPKKRLDPFDDDEGKRAEARAEFQAMVDNLGETFIKYVIKNRGDHNGNLNGGIFIGDSAVDTGYADSIRFLAEVLLPKSNKNKGKGKMSTKTETEPTKTGDDKNKVETPTPDENGDISAAEAAVMETARIKAINAMPGTDSLKLKAIVEGMSVEDAAKMMLEEAEKATGDEHLETQAKHERENKFPATHAKAAEGEDALVKECLGLWDKHGSLVHSQAIA